MAHSKEPNEGQKKASARKIRNKYARIAADLEAATREGISVEKLHERRTTEGMRLRDYVPPPPKPETEHRYWGFGGR